MSAFVLKIIAVITMTCDHLSYLIFGQLSFLNFIGRIAFPIFAYQISEGYIHTRNLKKYFLRLFVFALISQIPFMLFTSIFTTHFSLNIFFTLLFGLFTIILYDKIDKKTYKTSHMHIFCNVLGVIAACLIALLAEILHTDYGAFGVSIIFLFYFFRNHKVLMNLSFILSVLIYYGNSIYFNLFIAFTRPELRATMNNGTVVSAFQLAGIYIGLAICTIIPIIFINLYNHKKGKDTKYFLYLFYPLHLLIIYLLSIVL